VDRDHPRASVLRDVYSELHSIIGELEGLWELEGLEVRDEETDEETAEETDDVHDEERSGREILLEFYLSIVTNIFEVLEVDHCSLLKEHLDTVYTDYSLASQRRSFCKILFNGVYPTVCISAVPNISNSYVRG
jgi:hypothetical protein